jgi:glycine receptor alpha-3
MSSPLLRRFWTVLLIVIVALISEPSPVSGYTPLKQLIDSLFTNYEKGIRPNYGDRPVRVGITVYVLGIEDVDEKEMEFTITMYLRQHWEDPRLKFNKGGMKGPDETIRLDSSKSDSVWVPDTFVVNEKSSFTHTLTNLNEFVRIGRHGDVLKSERVTITASCNMDLTFFPMDTQICSLEIESFGCTTRDTYYTWDKGLINSGGVSPDVASVTHKIMGYRLREHNISLSTGDYSRITLDVQLTRRISRSIIRFYTPMSVFPIVSLMALWLSNVQTGALVCFLNIALMTVLIGFRVEEIPTSTYLNGATLYIAICLVTMGICASVSVLNVLFATSKKDRRKTLREVGNLGKTHRSRGCRGCCGKFLEVLLKYFSGWVLPIGFAALVVLYWIRLRLYATTKVLDGFVQVFNN